MLFTDIIHHTEEKSKKIIRSHRLHPREGITVFLLLASEKENILSIVEDHLLETLSGVEWDSSIENDFAYVSENYNHFSQNLAWEDKNSIHAIFAVLSENSLTFSHTGETEILLVDEKGELIPLSTAERDTHEFQALSSGEVMEGTEIYLVTEYLEDKLWEDAIGELSSLDDENWKDTITSTLAREKFGTIHIWIIRNKKKKEKTSRSWGQIDILGSNLGLIWSKWVKSLWQKIDTLKHYILDEKWKETRYVFLWTWIILLFILTYSLFGTIFHAISSTNTDSKNQLIHARELIEQSQKLTTNPQAFTKNISEATTILFELRKQGQYTADTQELLMRIEAMKKEVNDIQTVDIKKLPSIIKSENSWLSSILGTFEYNKKFTLVGKNWAVIWHVKWETITRMSAYPAGEMASDFTYGDDGNFFILTESDRILSPRRTDITYVTVTGQDGWGKSSNLKTFNGNIYLIPEDLWQIYRHKPWINGFSAKTWILPAEQKWKIIDIGIDGGIYILKDDGKIIRYIAWKPEKNITLNKIPGEYDLGKEENTTMVIQPNLSYIYIQSGNKIWIFSPDSKRFQDVTAWNYVAQLELSWEEKVTHISVPRDGTIYVTTESWVYELWFEIADNKILLRS